MSNLHSPDYRERYADNLSKKLPRIPRVRTAADFRAFSKAGRDLAELHLNYESMAMYAGATVTGPEGKPFDFAALRSGRTVMGTERTGAGLGERTRRICFASRR